ncbi:hypothetical protein, partial [Gemmobacter denitrificans]
SISGRSKTGQAAWWEGICNALSRFRSAWPKKGLTKDDRRLLEIVDNGAARSNLTEFAALIALRQERNLV